MINARTLSLTFLFAATVLAGCGGGGAEMASDAPPPPPSAPPFLGPAATIVLGQSSLSEGGANRGGAPDASTLNGPIGNVAIGENGTLFVPDTVNGRIIAYRTVPAENGAAASFVFGKPDFTTPASDETSQSLTQTPISVSIADGKMAVADAFANRVLIYDTVPAQDGALASFVVGQATFTDVRRGCFSHMLDTPRAAVLTPNGKLIVADTENNRVLIWNSVPAEDGLSAEVVLGQSNFVHCAANDRNQDHSADEAPTEQTLKKPFAVWSDGDRLIVADSGNNRVLIWRHMPVDSTQSFMAADIVLGQTSSTTGAVNDAEGDGIDNAAATALTFADPRAVHSDGVRLAVADTGNNRVLIWNTIPTRSGVAPDRVIGQSDFTRTQPNDVDQDGDSDSTPSATVLSDPRGVFLHGTTLFVSDTGNNRVLLFQLAQ